MVGTCHYPRYFVIQCDSTVQGWSPLAAFAEQHIKAQSRLETIRGQPATFEAAAKPESGTMPLEKAHHLHQAEKQERDMTPLSKRYRSQASEQKRRAQTQGVGYQALHAPTPPSAPQMWAAPIAPTPPLPPTYTIIYPNGQVQQFVYPSTPIYPPSYPSQSPPHYY